MNAALWFLRRLFALVLGVAGFAFGLWIMYSKCDTGGGFAAIAGTALVLGVLCSDSF